MTVCIVVNGEKFQSHAVTLTLIGQCPMSNSSELFPYTTICSSFKWIEPLFFELPCTQTDRHTDGDEYSIVAVIAMNGVNPAVANTEVTGAALNSL